jgi:hypothetical protein
VSRASRNVAAAILLLALIASGPAQGRATVECSPSSPCPDLIVRVLDAGVTDHGGTVVIDVEVENSGAADAPPSTVEATASGSGSGSDAWAPASREVRSLKSDGDFDPLKLTLPVPDAARGTRQSFLVQVDPADAVDESDEGNNRSKTKALFFPAGDLVIQTPTSAFADGGRTLVLTATVVNQGKGTTAATSLEAGAKGWTQGTARVDALDPGGSQTVDVRVTIPDTARGHTSTVTATVDPAHDVAETSYDDNVSLSLDIAIDAGDLTATIVGSQLSSDRRRLVLSVRVTNAGTAPTAATFARTGSGSWKHAATPVRSLDGGADTTVEIALAVPADAGGTTTSFVATVDPVHDIAESSYANNDSTPFEVTVRTTPPPPQPRHPNLSVRIVRATVHGDPRITLVLDIRNSGGKASRATTVAVSARGGPSRAAPVPVVRGHSSRRISIGLILPEARRNRTLRYVAVVDPAHDIPESNYGDNASMPFAVAVQGPAAGSSWPRWAGFTGALALAMLALGFALSRIRIRARVRWQREAQEDGPPETCQVPESHVWRRESKPKPALRRIEHMQLLMRGQGDDVVHEVAHELVEVLNSAVRARRLRRSEEKLHELLEPVAQGLVHEAEEWLDGGVRAVDVSAHLKGGKLECEFKRYECVQRGPACSWEERQSWKADVEDEADEPVATLNLPATPSEPERTAWLARLEGELLAFVDSLGLAPPPETAPIPE